MHISISECHPICCSGSGCSILHLLGTEEIHAIHVRCKNINVHSILSINATETVSIDATTQRVLVEASST